MTSPTNYEPTRYPPFAVTTDTAVFVTPGGQLEVVLVQRRNEPYRGSWTLPGGFVEPDEDLAEAASRELSEETGLSIAPVDLRQLGAYGTPGRDPRMRVVTVVYWAFLSSVPSPVGSSDAVDADVFRVDDALAEDFDLGFDHHQILTDAADRAAHFIGGSQ